MFIYIVTVNTVTLKDDGYTVTPSDMIVAHNGSEKHLECRPGTSRPAPMIVWYMGVNVIQRSKRTALTFIASVNRNNSIVSCRAYNLQPEQAAIASVAVKLVIKGNYGDCLHKRRLLTLLLILSPPNLKMSFGTTFTLSIILAFRNQTIE